MSRLDHLVASYKRHVGLPLKINHPLSQRIWFVVYMPEDEAKLPLKLNDFEMATLEAGLSWHRIDLSGSFAAWIDTYDAEEKEAILKDQELLNNYAETGYRNFLGQRIIDCMKADVIHDVNKAVFALTGLMEFFDFIDVSSVLDIIPSSTPGVLAVFFPGEKEGTSYRFLNSRTSWDYLAVPIVSEGQS